MEEKYSMRRRGFLKLAGAAGVATVMTAFPFRNMRAAWAFGDHPQ